MQLNYRPHIFKEYSQKVLLSLNETGKVNAEIVILKKHIYK